jgi:Cation transport ATPase
VLTGESAQVERGTHEAVRSGVVNAGGVFELRATATAQDSTYAEIVRMAQHAGAERAPTVRLAERYAAWFPPLSLGMAGLARLVSGSAERAVAVLVVATPARCCSQPRWPSSRDCRGRRVAASSSGTA